MRDQAYSKLLVVGTYVVAELDPLASVARLQDPDVDNAAREMRTRKYVGLIGGVWRWPDPDFPLVKVKLYLVGQGMPSQADGEAPHASMSVPIFPSTTHPLSREPLRPPEALPWENCYQHSALNVNLRVVSVDGRNPSRIVLPSDEVARLEGYVLEDRQRSLDVAGVSSVRLDRLSGSTLIAVSPISTASQSPFTASKPTFPSPDDMARDILPGPEYLPTPIAVQVFDDEDLEVTAVSMTGSSSTSTGLPPSDWPSRPPKLLIPESSPSSTVEITAKLSLDLSTVPFLPDPVEFFEELAQLTRLQKEVRKKQRKSRQASRIEGWVYGANSLTPGTAATNSRSLADLSMQSHRPSTDANVVSLLQALSVPYLGHFPDVHHISEDGVDDVTLSNPKRRVSVLDRMRKKIGRLSQSIKPRPQSMLQVFRRRQEPP